MLSPSPKRTKADPTDRGTFDCVPREDGKPVSSSLQTVLLVDDDDALREVRAACLGMMGYVVVPCSDAQAAVKAFRSTGVDLLLTDLQMPGRSGVELARELTQVRPELPVIIISGNLLTDELTAEMERRRWKFIPKPCSLENLAGLIQTMLAPRVHTAAR